jgi:hypothetical protein
LYEVTISYTGSLNTVRQREPVITFFTNLRKAVDAVVGELAINNWPIKVNYTAVYRGIRERGFYACDYDLKGLRVFRIRIMPRVLNPVLPRVSTKIQRCSLVGEMSTNGTVDPGAGQSAQ